MTQPVITDYLFDEAAYNTHDGGYIPLEKPSTPPQPLAIPAIATPDRVDGKDVYYTITAQTGEVQLLPGAKTKTWATTPHCWARPLFTGMVKPFTYT